MNFLLQAGGYCGAIAAILAVMYGCYRGMKVVYAVDSALPTLLSIADEFKNNGGSTLKDSVDRIEANMVTKQELADHAENDLTVAADLALKVDTSATELAAKVNASHQELLDAINEKDKA